MTVTPTAGLVTTEAGGTATINQQAEVGKGFYGATAMILLGLVGLAARALSNVVRGATAEAGLTNSGFLAKVASFIVWTFTIVVAVNQIGIARKLS